VTMSDETVIAVTTSAPSANGPGRIDARGGPMSQNVPGRPNGGATRNEAVAQLPAGLSDAQCRAIELLIVGTLPGKVAKRCGVDRRTVYRWRHECEPFRAELERLRREMWAASADQMRAMICKSLSVLAVELDNVYDNSRFRAASTILRVANVRKLIESEMTERE